MTTICLINQTNFHLIRHFLLDTEGIPDDIKQIAKKMRKSSNKLKRDYKQNVKDHYQRLLDEIRQKEALDACRHQLNLINKQKIAIYYGYINNSNTDPVPLATPVAETIEPPPTPTPTPIIYDSGDDSDSSDSDSDVESLDGMEDDDSDDEPIANLLNDPDLQNYNICSARCASGTRQEVGRCTNPTTSFETNHLGQRVGVCRLHKRAIDTAMAKYFQWDRTMGHLYGWWNSPETISERNRNAVLQAGYQGARRQPKRRKTRRFRGQIKGNGSVYSGVRVVYR